MFDTDVVLDVLLARKPHDSAATVLFSMADRGRLDGVLCATTLTTVHYLAGKAVGRKQAEQHVQELMSLFEVARVDREVLQGAMRLGFDDFEDAVLHEAAAAHGATAIVTRNHTDFVKASLPILQPAELLAVILGQDGRE